MGQEPDSLEAALPDTIVFQSHIQSSELQSIADTGYIFISDTVDVADILPVEHLDMEGYARHSPAKAAIMSAVVPGLGQIYNRQYWKVPVVYVAMGFSIHFFLKWQNEFNRYRRAYIDINDKDPFTNFHETLGLPTSRSQTEIQQYITKRKEKLRTWRDWTIVAMAGAYALNVIDANVFAHLMDFSIDDNLSLHIQPCFLQNQFVSQKIGLTLQLTF